MELPRYDPNWPLAFEEERDQLKAQLGDVALRIDHVGSTSVPGLQAKPVIDIQISVEEIDLSFLKKELSKLGYKHTHMDDPPVDVYPFFHKPARWPTTHHIHVCHAGGEEERLHLIFRNWLRGHPADRDEYGRLKDELAKDVDEKNIQTLYTYTDKKGIFVQEIIKKAIQAGISLD